MLFSLDNDSDKFDIWTQPHFQRHSQLIASSRFAKHETSLYATC